MSEIERKYTDLAKSKDAKIKGFSERILNLVKFQEWGTASGKSPIARYIGHDADMSHIKLEVSQGSGKDRTTKEYNVEVDKLNKLSQSRVKQISTLEKRIDELVAASGDKGTASGAGPSGAAPEMHNAGRRNNRRNDAAAAGPGNAPIAEAPPSQPAQPQPPQPDPSASEPDPLGFAELPPVSPPAGSGVNTGPLTPGPSAGPPQNPGPSSGPPPTPAPVATPNAGEAGSAGATGKQWRNDIGAFAASITAGTDPNGKPIIHWGELKELGQMNDLVAAQRAPGATPTSPEGETPATISNRLGDMHWQLTAEKVEAAPGGLVNVEFRTVDLPKPLQIHFAVDDSDDLQKWAKIPAGTAVNVIARLTITEPNKIVAKVKLADGK